MQGKINLSLDTTFSLRFGDIIWFRRMRLRRKFGWFKRFLETLAWRIRHLWTTQGLQLLPSGVLYLTLFTWILLPFLRCLALLVLRRHQSPTEGFSLFRIRSAKPPLRFSSLGVSKGFCFERLSMGSSFCVLESWQMLCRPKKGPLWHKAGLNPAPDVR